MHSLGLIGILIFAAALGPGYFNVHSLRHSFATFCIKDRIPVTTVKEFLGHSNISVTIIYAKTDESVKVQRTSSG
jgi:site-specific recombinase XerD